MVSITEVVLYEGMPETDGAKELGEENPLINDPENLYLYYAFSIDDLDGISSGTKYSINVPQGLKITGEENTVDLKAKVEGENGTTTEEKYATLTWGPSGASIKFVEGIADFGELTGCTLYFGCAFDKSKATPEGDEPNRYKIEFCNGTSVIVGLADEEPIETEAQLAKTCKDTDPKDNILTWTITYTPAQNKGMTGFEIHDTLGRDLEPAFLDTDGTVDTSKVTVKRGDQDITSSVSLKYETRTLSISDMKEDEGTGDITITYSTTIPDTYLLPPGSGPDGSDPGAGNTDSGSSKGGTFTNTATLWGKEPTDTTPQYLGISAEAEHTLQKIQYLKKTGEKVEDNPHLLQWTVTINQGIATDADADFTLEDTLPDSLTLVTDATTTLPEGVPEGTYTPKLNEEDCTLDVEGQTFTLEIGGDDNQFKDDGTATLVYYTTVADSYFEDGSNNLGSNVAELSISTNTGPDSDYYKTKVSVPVGTGGAGVDTARVTKSGEVQKDDKRTVQWTVTINPNKADLQSASLTDNLADMLFNDDDDDAEKMCLNQGSHEYGAKLLVDDAHPVTVKFEGDYYNTNGQPFTYSTALPESGVTTIYDIKENTEGITGGTWTASDGAPLGLLQLSYNPKTENNNKVLTIRVPENMEGNGKAVGHTSITVTFYTQFTDPCIYAGNGKATTATNSIDVGNMKLGGNASSTFQVDAEVKLNTTMLEKQPPVYDYETGAFTWTVVVNEDELPLKDLELTEKALPMRKAA